MSILRPSSTVIIQEFGTWVTEHFANDQSERVPEQLLDRLFQYTPAKPREKLVGHGEVARLVAVEMGLGAVLIESLNFVFERWDSTGAPSMAGGERIPLVARIMHLANELEVHARLHKAEAAVAMADYRASGAFDPHLVWLFCQASGRVLEVLEARSPWEAAMAADPVAGLVEAAASGLGLPIDEVKFSAPSFSRSVAAWNLAVRG